MPFDQALMINYVKSVNFVYLDILWVNFTGCTQETAIITGEVSQEAPFI